jgi:deoxyribodipyrimidine photo-lyase
MNVIAILSSICRHFTQRPLCQRVLSLRQNASAELRDTYSTHMTPTESPSLVWLRDDLRLDDNPALIAAASDGPVVALYVLDDSGKSGRPLGGAARWWLHHSLTRLSESLARQGVTLLLRAGDPNDIVPEVAAKVGATSVHWNRRYFAWSKPMDSAIKQSLIAKGIKVESHKGNVLTEPWEIKTGSGGYFKVFTPFFRAATPTCDAWAAFASPMPTMTGGMTACKSDELSDWRLLPTSPDWSKGLSDMWTPGEVGAASNLEAFLGGAITGYRENRNVPSVVGTSRLSPHIRFGEVSIRRVWNAARAKMAASPQVASDGQTFLSELGWREFSTQLVYHYEDFPDQSWKPEFRAFPWKADNIALRAWQKGMTGYPIVDAGMRELWATGWMHNRVRMIVASLLVKHLLQDWRDGEAWFWDTLVDADIANNAAGWQWVAGSGADASPYFRIFNPMTQGENFDPKGKYVRRWVPEIARLPDSLIHRPFDAPREILAATGITLGKTYPFPIIDHAAGRQRALEALASFKGKSVSGASA